MNIRIIEFCGFRPAGGIVAPDHALFAPAATFGLSLSIGVALLLSAPGSVCAAECSRAVLGERVSEDLDCKTKGKVTWDGSEAVLVSATDKKASKKKPQVLVYVVKGETAKLLKIDPAIAADSAAKTFAKAFTLNADKNSIKRVLKSDYKTVAEDLCLSFTGPEALLVGEVLFCNASPTKVTTPVEPALVPAATPLAKAKQLVLKEFARLEKEEDIPKAAEIFGDPDTVSRMIVGPDLKSTMYYFWVSLFSKNGVALIAVGLDGKLKSETIEGTMEFSAPSAEARIRRWK